MQCPNRDQLQAYARGSRDPELVPHVEGCETCQAALDELAPDEEFRNLIREAAAEEPLSAEECRQAIAAAEALGPDPAQVAGQPAHVASTVWQVPNPLGRYELLAPPISTGGIGVVYQARQVPFGRSVAVKVLRNDHQSREAVARFKREVLATAKVQHPHIVVVYDADEVHDMPFLVMELIRGKSLSELLRKYGPLPIADASELVRQATIGLSHAHAHGLVHRDLKPSNLMLTELGQVKILDFGLARPILPDEAEAPLTIAGQILGTADYIAPEQIEKSSAADARADLYSLGATLYHLLAGRPPFHGEKYTTTLAKLLAHLHDPVPPLRDLRPEVPEALAALVHRLLEKKSADRPRTTAELHHALQPFTADCDLFRLLGPATQNPPLAPRPVLPSGAPTMPNPSARPLDAMLDVLFWDQNRQRHVSITEPGALPVRTGAQVQIEARLTRPAYLYLIWVNSEGLAQPLYPWQASQWTGRPAEVQLPRLLLPPRDAVHGYRTFPIDTPAGIETVILLANETALTQTLEEDLPTLLAGFPRRQPLPDPALGLWFACQDVGYQPARIGAAGPGPAGPVFQIHSLLRDGLGPRFSLVRAVSFANLGC